MITAGEASYALLRSADQLRQYAASDWTARHVLGWSEAEREDWLRVSDILVELHQRLGGKLPGRGRRSHC